jgi:hypothetical protein
MNPDEKKIIIDEDWKAQVQAEKEAAAKAQAAGKSNETGGTAAAELRDVPMPPASLELLLSTLATEALVALGEVAHPADGKVHVHPNQAKYLIDTIDVLRQKTKGNLTPVEEQTVESLLHQLRMIFVTKMSESKPVSEPAGSV